MVHYHYLQRRAAHRHPRKKFASFFAGFAFGPLHSPRDTDYLRVTGKLGCIAWSQLCQSNSYKRKDCYTHPCEEECRLCRPIAFSSQPKLRQSKVLLGTEKTYTSFKF